MMQSPGRGLGGSGKRRTHINFHLIRALPSVFSYARSDSVATYRNNQGKMLKVTTTHTPRFDHDESGFPLGLLIEAQIQNKVTLYNALPTVTTGITTSGTATISLVSDTVALTAAGLELLVSGNVFQAVGGASGGTITLPGTTGNTSAHSLSVYARITAGTSAILTHTGTSPGMQTISGAGWSRFKLENQTMSGSSVQMRLTIPAATTVLFILPQLEQNRFCTSPIVTSGAAATRQRDDVTIASLATRPFWNLASGWILARYRVMGNMGVDQHPVLAHSGNSNNSIGIRLSASGFVLQANTRASSTSKMSSSGTAEHSAGVAASALMTWKSGTGSLAGNGEIVTASYSGDPGGITTLQVGARSSGSDPFFGHISMIEIGRSYLTPAKIALRLKRSGDMVVIGAGQSLIGGHFSSPDGSSQIGRRKMLEAMQAAGKGSHPVFLNGATTSSAACKTSNGSNYWWDVAGNVAGPALTTFHTLLTNTVAGIDAILWGQGEEDSHYINDETPRAAYKAALLAIFANMRTRVGDVPVFIQKIGRRGGSFYNPGGIQEIRNIQQELIDGYDWIFEASDIYDQTLYDDIHPGNTGFGVIGERNGRQIAKLLAGVTPHYGPKMIGAVRSGTSVTVTLSHSGGSDFTPSSAISGFYFLDSSSAITINAAVRSNATTITLTLNSTPSSGTETLYYIYDAAASVTVGNLVQDNSGMPLRSGFVIL